MHSQALSPTELTPWSKSTATSMTLSCPGTVLWNEVAASHPVSLLDLHDLTMT